MLRELLDRFRPRDAPALATAYSRDGRLFIQASDRTVRATAGFWVSAGPVACLAAADPPALVGAAVLEAPLRQAVGVRSRRALMAGMRACGISREGGELHVLPYDNGGTTGEARGYRGRPDAEALRLPTDAPAEAVGRAVRAALEQATPGPGAPVT